jgi:thiol-disulfide isomerase/thioredoxin
LNCILAALALTAICACGPRESENVLYYVSNTCDWDKELRVTHVERTDTATILTFYYKTRQPWYTLCILPQTYLSDEHDRHYRAISMQEHNLGEYFGSGLRGTYFHVSFEPLARDVKIFDMMEGLDPNKFKILGIHDSTYVPAKPHFSRKDLQEADAIRRSIFQQGAITLRGRIVGYNQNSGFQTYQMHYTLYDEDDPYSVALDIDPDGRFEYSFDVPNMLGASIVDHNRHWHNFIAQPGDTLDITFYMDGTVSYALSDGRPYLLRNYTRIPDGLYAIDRNLYQLDGKPDLPAVQEYTFQRKEMAHQYLDYIAVKYNLTAFEYQYATMIMENDLLENFLDYRMDILDSYILKSKDQKFDTWDDYMRMQQENSRAFRDPETYKFLSAFPASDTLMMLLPHQWVIFNRYRFDPSFNTGYPTLDSLDGLMPDYLIQILEYQQGATTDLENDRRVFGADKPSLLAKLCIMQRLEQELNSLNYCMQQAGCTNPDSVYAEYLSMFKSMLNDPNLEPRLDRRFIKYKRSLEPYWDLPECRGKEVLSRILAHYPSKYVYLDFWSTGCGPCVAGIKDCYNRKRSLMTGQYDKFALVFITSDPDQVYEPFRKEWLDGAQSYRVSQDDYNSLAGLFNFSGIPHHELITPDGRAVSKVPDMMGVDPESPDPNK